MLNNLLKELNSLANPAKAKILQGFFKTGKGQYGEGDIFLGITLPEQHAVVKKYITLSLTSLDKLIKSKIHERRVVALLILVEKFQKSTNDEEKTKIYNFYLKHTVWINNWDLVDLSAPKIVGPYLENKNKAILVKLAKSKNLWERRIAILATFYDIYQGKPEQTIKIAELLLNDTHDLIQKAVGWMLREVGKRCGEKYLISFLDIYASTMPRTALRYSIERLNLNQKKHFLQLKTKL